MNSYKRIKTLDKLINTTRVKIHNLEKKLKTLKSDLNQALEEKTLLDQQLQSATIILSQD